MSLDPSTYEYSICLRYSICIRFAKLPPSSRNLFFRPPRPRFWLEYSKCWSASINDCHRLWSPETLILKSWPAQNVVILIALHTPDPYPSTHCPWCSEIHQKRQGHQAVANPCIRDEMCHPSLVTSRDPCTMRSWFGVKKGWKRLKDTRKVKTLWKHWDFMNTRSIQQKGRMSERGKWRDKWHMRPRTKTRQELETGFSPWTEIQIQIQGAKTMYTLVTTKGSATSAVGRCNAILPARISNMGT